MELVILARAEAEVLETQARSEDVVSGLGDRFSIRAEEAFDRVADFPEVGLSMQESFGGSWFAISHLGFSTASKVVASSSKPSSICASNRAPSIADSA